MLGENEHHVTCVCVRLFGGLGSVLGGDVLFVRLFFFIMFALLWLLEELFKVGCTEREPPGCTIPCPLPVTFLVPIH